MVQILLMCQVLAFVATKKIGYASFGGGKTKPFDRNVYNLHSKGKKGTSTVTFNALEVPIKCAPLRRSNADAEL